MNPWPTVKHFFEVDDGMLPDIYVENLMTEQTVAAYEWIMSQCSIANSPTLWSIEKEIDIPIRELQYPAREFAAGRVETFRHCLAGLSVNGVELPQLSVSVEDGGISFDYRAGEGWNEKTVLTLFEFLYQLKNLFPNARIFQADEGGIQLPMLSSRRRFSSLSRRPLTLRRRRDVPDRLRPELKR